MAETAKKATAKKAASSSDKPVQRGSYESLDKVPDADMGTGKLANDVHMTGENGVEIFEAGTDASDLPDWAMAVLRKNHKAWERDEDDEE